MFADDLASRTDEGGPHAAGAHVHADKVTGGDTFHNAWQLACCPDNPRSIDRLN